MTETLPLPETDVEKHDLFRGASDESLIDTAKELNASYNGHLRRSIEDFWRLGQTLSHLFQRRHLKGRWANILIEIGISTTTDNHARRLYQGTTIDGLSEYKNKTAALRGLGILSTPTASTGERGMTSPEVSANEPVENPAPYDVERDADDPEGGYGEDRVATMSDLPDNRIAPTKKRITFEKANVPAADREDDQTPPTVCQPPGQQADDSLERLAMVAARLEYMAADQIDITPDHLTQIDRMLRAIDLIRTKGGAHVAA